MLIVPQDAFRDVEPDRLLVEESAARWLWQNWLPPPWGKPWGILGKECIDSRRLKEPAIDTDFAKEARAPIAPRLGA